MRNGLGGRRAASAPTRIADAQFALGDVAAPLRSPGARSTEGNAPLASERSSHFVCLQWLGSVSPALMALRVHNGFSRTVSPGSSARFFLPSHPPHERARVCLA